MEKNKIRAKNYYEKNKEIISLKHKKYVKRNRSKLRNKRLKKRFGISAKDYNILFKKQEGKCKICNKEIKNLSVDHCHKSGLIRGLLCRKCNTGLGQFNDNPILLSNAIKYLKQ